MKRAQDLAEILAAVQGDMQAHLGHGKVADYIPALAREIVAIFDPAGRVAIAARIEAISLDLKIMPAIGIILNELITNSMKYAFAGVAEPAISISAERRGESLRLVYEDNGAGLPAGFSFEGSRGFGMRLLTSLAAQIKGSIRAEESEGARFVIEFPV